MSAPPNNQRTEILTGVLVLSLLALLLAPLPGWALDLFLVLDIAVGLLLLFLALQSQRALDLSTFPSLILLATLFRLALNVASTRLILLQGQAGAVIGAFGEFVVGGDVVVGLVVFAILLVIQFLVITKGAERVAEVAARFTLDALPGKQMAIDADLNAGLIDETKARQRRDEVSREAEFYGAMDGASKFVRGDAIASLIITAVNLVGGIVRGLSAGDTLAAVGPKYAILTVGDAIASQIPALLLSTAAGIVITKSSTARSLGGEVGLQVARRPLALALAAGFSGILGLVPGLPFLPFAGIGIGLGLAARAAAQASERTGDGVADEGQAEGQSEPLAAAEPEPAELARVDRISLEVGLALVPLVDAQDGLVARIAQARRRIAARTGFVAPVVRIRDDLGLASGAYRLSIDGVTVARGEVVVDHLLAIAPDELSSLDDLPGFPTRDPAFGLDARWIPAHARGEAELRGLALADPASVIVTHWSEVVERLAHEILSRDDVEQLVERAQEQAPAAVKGMVPETFSLGTLQKVLAGLLREGVAISNLPRILEAMGDLGANRPPEDYVEAVRVRLARQLREAVCGADGVLRAITIEPRTEEQVAQVGREGGLDAAGARFLGERLKQAVEIAQLRGLELPVVLARSDVRRRIRDLLASAVPEVVVLSHAEVLGADRIESVEVIGSQPEELDHVAA